MHKDSISIIFLILTVGVSGCGGGGNAGSGSTSSTSSTATVNDAPVANAGADKTVPVGSLVQLSGNKSSDINGDQLTYNWIISSMPTGSITRLVMPTSVDPSFTPDVIGEYKISLTVHDGTLGSISKVVTITALRSLGPGKVTTDFGANEYANDVVIQADGKIVAAGGSGDGFAVARYNLDGSLDTSFSSDGKVKTLVGTFNDDGKAVALQLDGKIVVAGISENDFALVRYNTDGSLDTSFGGSGAVTTRFIDGDAWAKDVTVQADQKILVVGSQSYMRYFNWNTLQYSYYERILVTRYNPDGSLDTSFNFDGILRTYFGTDSGASSVITQPDGMILVAAYSDGKGAVGRFKADGSSDYSFNFNGISLLPNMGTRSLALQSDGKILVAGSISSNFALARLNADGSLDTSFDLDGITSTDLPMSSASSLTLQSDGKIVVAGDHRNGLYDNFTLIRYNIDGSLDTTFDSDGKVTIIFVPTDYEGANGIAIQADGKILVIGYSGYLEGSNFALARLNPDGSLDSTFGLLP